MPAHIALVACLKQAQKNKGIKKPIKPCLLRRRRIALITINSYCAVRRILLTYIFYCYHDRKTHKQRINASPYGAGGLASRKPEKNKGIKKPILKHYLFSSSFIYSFPILLNETPAPRMARRDE